MLTNWINLLFHPWKSFPSLKINRRESIGILIAFLLTSCLWSGLNASYQIGSDEILSAVGGTALGTTAGWLGLTAFLYMAAQAIGGMGLFQDFLFWMGYAALPMIVTNLLSILIFLISPILLPEIGGASWKLFHDVLGILGILLGWPGLLSFFALRHGMNLPTKKAALLILGILAFIGFGWLLPVIVPGAFNN